MRKTLLLGVLLALIILPYISYTGVAQTSNNDQHLKIKLYSDGSFRVYVNETCESCESSDFMSIKGSINNDGTFTVTGLIKAKRESGYEESFVVGKMDFSLSLFSKDATFYTGTLKFQFVSTDGSIILNIDKIESKINGKTVTLYADGKLFATGMIKEEVDTLLSNITNSSQYLQEMNITVNKLVLHKENGEYTFTVNITAPYSVMEGVLESYTGSYTGGVVPPASMNYTSNIAITSLSLNSHIDENSFNMNFNIIGKSLTGKLVIPLSDIGEITEMPTTLANRSIEILPSEFSIEIKNNTMNAILPRVRFTGTNTPEEALAVLSALGETSPNTTVTLVPGEKYMSITPRETTLGNLSKVVVTIEKPVTTSGATTITHTPRTDNRNMLTIGATIGAIIIVIIAGIVVVTRR
jgi:hypothetical protein